MLALSVAFRLSVSFSQIELVCRDQINTVWGGGVDREAVKL